MNGFDRHLFLLLNAPADAAAWQVGLALTLAEYLIYALPPLLVLLWVRGDRQQRDDLVRAVLSVALALAFGQAIGYLWAQQRPFVQHLGSQLLAHAPDASFPSDHALVFLGLGLGFFIGRRLAWLGLLLMAAGVLVGASRVFLGVHFPLDIAGAFPVAAAAALLCRAADPLIMRAISTPAQNRYAALLEWARRTVRE